MLSTFFLLSSIMLLVFLGIDLPSHLYWRRDLFYFWKKHNLLQIRRVMLHLLQFLFLNKPEILIPLVAINLVIISSIKGFRMVVVTGVVEEVDVVAVYLFKLLRDGVTTGPPFSHLLLVALPHRDCCQTRYLSQINNPTTIGLLSFNIAIRKLVGSTGSFSTGFHSRFRLS